ncbi:hypothetical protein K8I28_12300 [bacterium]|nr:hypothetical protein [bacterium]
MRRIYHVIFAVIMGGFIGISSSYGGEPDDSIMTHQGDAVISEFKLIATTLENLKHTIQTHPNIAAEDIYKFLHQAVMGPAHFHPDPNHILQYLQFESEQLTAVAGEDIVERLSPLYSRIHLNALLEKGGSLDSLARAVQNSLMSTKNGSILATLLNEVINNDILPAHIERIKFSDLVRELAEKNYPAIHHSDKYRDEYKPHYRVVSNSQVEWLLETLK